MSISVYLSINKGSGKGTIYDFSSPTSIYVGRHNDCGIIVLEPTVSRYHCLIDIVPPSVKVRDFGSLNGTFVNQVLIGKREKNQSIEEAQKKESIIVDLHDGDKLRLGNECEIGVQIKSDLICSRPK